MSVILIIEREAQWSHIICHAMHQAGYDTITAINGEDALKLLTIHRPDAVLVDETILAMCGKDYCEHLKCNHPNQAVPVIVHTHISPTLVEGTSYIDFILDNPTALPELLNRIDQLLLHPVAVQSA